MAPEYGPLIRSPYKPHYDTTINHLRNVLHVFALVGRSNLLLAPGVLDSNRSCNAKMPSLKQQPILGGSGDLVSPLSKGLMGLIMASGGY